MRNCSDLCSSSNQRRSAPSEKKSKSNENERLNALKDPESTGRLVTHPIGIVMLGEPDRWALREAP